MRPLRAAAALAALLAAAAGSSAADGLALRPPMGWNSWNKFGCNVSETLVRGAADALVASGMKAAGYEYVVIDDCWQVGRAEDGAIVVDEERFPSGMKALAGDSWLRTRLSAAGEQRARIYSWDDAAARYSNLFTALGADMRP